MISIVFIFLEKKSKLRQRGSIAEMAPILRAFATTVGAVRSARIIQPAVSAGFQVHPVVQASHDDLQAIAGRDAWIHNPDR